MSIINSTERILKAVLTRTGRDILQKNNERFIITKAAFGDNEINYNLVNSQDPDSNDVQSIAVFEPSTNEDTGLKSKLIRFTEDLDVIAQQNQYRFIPNTEYQITTQTQGNTTFSINNWNQDATTISFSILNPNTNSYFLGNGFIIDFSEFYSKYGIAFDIFPLSPSATLGQSNKYWYNTTDNYKDDSGNILPVVIGIDNDHRPFNGTQLSDIVNDLNIPIITFKVKINERDLKKLLVKLLNDKTSFLEGNVIITNDDQDVVPATDFYGVNKSYKNISTKIPIKITF